MARSRIDWRHGMKICLGLMLGFGIGYACRMFVMPSPAPTAMAGAILVLAMTCGWKMTDFWFVHRPKKYVPHPAGPTGKPLSTTED